LQGALILAVARLAFEIPLRGSLVLVAAAVGVFAGVNLALGFLFSTLARVQMQAMQMTFFFFLPSSLLSGFMFPFSAMPAWAQVLGEMLPLTHFLRIIRGVTLRNVEAGYVIGELAPIAAFAIVTGFAALVSCRRALRAGPAEVLVGSRVDHIDAEGVSVSGRRIAARTVLWAAGVMASPAAQWLKADADNAGRTKVGADLSIPGLPNVYAIGDTALSNAWNGQPVPGLAPAAKQGGAYVAHVIRARVAGREPPQPFRYRHLGSLTTIGRKSAVADFGVIKLWGAPAWWLWGLVHVGFLVGMRNRVATMTNWFWAYLTSAGGIRLITGGPETQPGESVSVRLV
jgi:ABC-2 type transporter/NDH2 C-terminal domain/Pyridine nucleotide-disulphide oxidoreductase